MKRSGPEEKRANKRQRIGEHTGLIHRAIISLVDMLYPPSHDNLASGSDDEPNESTKRMPEPAEEKWLPDDAWAVVAAQLPYNKNLQHFQLTCQKFHRIVNDSHYNVIFKQYLDNIPPHWEGTEADFVNECKNIHLTFPSFIRDFFGGAHIIAAMPVLPFEQRMVDDDFDFFWHINPSDVKGYCFMRGQDSSNRLFIAIGLKNKHSGKIEVNTLFQRDVGHPSHSSWTVDSTNRHLSYSDLQRGGLGKDSMVGKFIQNLIHHCHPDLTLCDQQEQNTFELPKP